MVDPLIPGTIICRDLIVRSWLGEGGWGEVWLVESQSLGTEYALKRATRPIAASQDAMLGEIEAWISLPPAAGIVPCYFWEIGAAGEILALVQYISGGTLADHLRKGHLDAPAKVVDTLIQVADALTVLHECDLIHGDLTPENILVDESGKFQVTDFGLTAAQNQLGDLTAATLEYSGYEAATGIPLTPWTDLWSWGLIAIELLMGERFWLSGCAAEEIVSIARSQISLLFKSEPARVAVLDLAERCFSPAGWPSARTLAAALRQCYRDLTNLPYPRTPPPPNRRVPHQPEDMRRFGTISYASPQRKWDRAAATFGPELLPQQPLILHHSRRRSTAIAAERIFRSLVEVYEAHLDPDHCRDYLNLLEHLALAQEASTNHRAAAFTYRRLASQARRWSHQLPELRGLQAEAIIQFANRRLVMGNPRMFLLRLYDRAIRLREAEILRQGGNDPEANLPAAYVAKATACRYLGKMEEAIALCNLALDINPHDSRQSDPRRIEVAAYTFLTRSQSRSRTDPQRGTDLAGAVTLYQSLVTRGLTEYTESLANAQLTLIRSRGYGEPTVIANLSELQILEDQFWELITREERIDLIDHFARVLVRKSRELCVADANEDAIDVARRAVKWLEEAVIRQGRNDLRHELAVVLSFLARLLLHVRPQDPLAQEQVRRALRIWDYLNSLDQNRRYLPFIAQASGVLAFALSVNQATQVEAKLQIALARQAAAQCGVNGELAAQKQTLDLIEQAQEALAQFALD